MEILINQVGFDLGAPNWVMVQATEALGRERGRAQALDERGMLRYEADLEYAGAVKGWGQHYWRADFSGLTQPGEYEIRARVGLQQVRHEGVIVGAQRVARQTLALAAGFFYYQRCGAEVPGWHGPCHLDDGVLPDGTHADAVGGWHDAGDYNKFNGYTPLAVFALARTARRVLAGGGAMDMGAGLSPRPERAGMEPGPHPLARAPTGRCPAPPPAAEEAAWGGRWLAKMQDPATGFLRGDVFSGHRYWGKPEDETDNLPGNDDDRPIGGEPSAAHRAGAALLAFAALGRLHPHESLWSECAGRLEMAIADRDLGIQEQAALLLACQELPPTTSRHRRAQQAARLILAGQRPDGAFHDPQIVDEGLAPAALAEYALSGAGAPMAEQIGAALVRWVDFSAARSRNPFRLLQWDGTNLFYPYPEPRAWYVGQNSAYLSQAWAMLLAARLLRASAREAAARAAELAWAALAWVLGCNPFAVCMLEGAGQFNPPRYHHRYDSIPGHPRGAVPGAVCNGIVRESVERDAPRFDLRGNDYHSNEPWLPHNAYYLLAAAETARP